MELVLQKVVDDALLPTFDEFRLWVEAALAEMKVDESGELTIRIVDQAESAELNQQYRHKSGSTNVLSFPFEPPPGVPTDELPMGDLVICADVVVAEAQAQQKTAEAHWAHMVVHGVLHLLGLDHIEPQEAEQMEAVEVKILSRLGFSDPYA